MTGILVFAAVLLLLTTRTRKQRRAWRRVLAGVWWLLLLPLALLVPGTKKPLRKRAAAPAGAVLPRSAPKVIHDLDPVFFLPHSRRPLLRRRYAAGDDRPGQGPRYFTREQKAELLRIAGHQCQRVTAGWRCTARTDLKADHKIPYSWGGLTTIRNGQILCGHHNDSKGAHFADPGGESLPPPWLRGGRKGVVRN